MPTATDYIKHPHWRVSTYDHDYDGWTTRSGHECLNRTATRKAVKELESQGWDESSLMVEPFLLGGPEWTEWPMLAETRDSDYCANYKPPIAGGLFKGGA